MVRQTSLPFLFVLGALGYTLVASTPPAIVPVMTRSAILESDRDSVGGKAGEQQAGAAPQNEPTLSAKDRETLELLLSALAKGDREAARSS